eukprot:492267_1
MPDTGRWTKAELGAYTLLGEPLWREAREWWNVHQNGTSLVVKLGAAPVAALLVPLDAVAGAKADPVGNRLVLLELLTVLLLDGERLETSHVSFVAIKYRNCN